MMVSLKGSSVSTARAYQPASRSTWLEESFKSSLNASLKSRIVVLEPEG